MPRKMMQNKRIAAPFGGLDRSVSTEELAESQHSIASEVLFDRGYFCKRNGRIPVGDTYASPLNGKVLKLYLFEKLDGTQALLAFTATKVYKWQKGEASWTDITGSAVFNATGWTVVRYINKVYFTTHGTEDIYYWDIGDATITALAAGYTGKALAVYGERLHVLNTYEGGVWSRQRDRWTNIGNTTFTAADFNDLVGYMGEDGIEHADLLASSCILYGSNTIVELSYTGSTTIPFAYRLCSTGAGLASSRAFVNLGDSHAYLSGDGIKLFDLGLVPKAIDQKVSSWFFSVVNMDYFDVCVMTKSEKDDEIILYYPEATHSENNRFIALNLSTGVWTEGSRGASCACQCTLTGSRVIDQIIGTIDQQTGTIDSLGAPISALTLYVGTEDGEVYSEFEGDSIETEGVPLDLQTKDFNFDDDEGTVWMGLEYEARGDSVRVSYSLDQGKTWTDMLDGCEIDDLAGTIDSLSDAIADLGDVQELTSDWTRYRHDVEGISKTCRFRFQNVTAEKQCYVRWYRVYFLRTGTVGTLPT